MNVNAVVACLVGLLVAGSASSAMAQQAESQLQLVAELHIDPAMFAQFESVNQGRNERMARANVSFLTRASVSEDFDYLFVTPVGDWAGIEKRQAEMAGIGPGNATNQRIVREAIESIDTSIQRTRPELSYVPDNPRLQPADYGFVHRIKLYLRFGTDAEVAELIQKAVALYSQHNSREVFFASRQVTGRDGPLLVLSFLATDVQDYYAHRQQTLEELGEELLTLRTQVAALCRRIENVNYTIRRDLSYQPLN